MSPTSRCLQYRAHPPGQRRAVVIASLTEADPRLRESAYYRDRCEGWNSLPYPRITRAAGVVGIDLTAVERDTLEHLGSSDHGWYDVAYDARPAKTC